MDVHLGEVGSVTITVENGHMVIEATGPERYVQALADKVWIEEGRLMWRLGSEPERAPKEETESDGD